MATSRLSDKLKAAITAAAAQLSQRQERLAKSAPAPGAAGSPTLTPTAALTPTPGDLYVFDTGQEVAIEWLVVRAHPDDPDLILLAPVDDFPLAGTPDLVLPVERVGRPMTVRCGETDWFPRALFQPDLRVDTIPDDLLALVRRRLADLARGRALPEAQAIDLDPEYEDWLAEVAQARSTLLARAELSQLTLRQPTPAPADRLPELALAAESGGSFRRMFSPSVVTEMFAVADEPLWRTNPRWCIRRLQPQQPALAERLAQALPPANPGVVGLVVDTISREALVVPLRAERSSDWYVDPTLPFHQAGTLAELLGRLVRSLGLPHLDGIPERFAYTLHDPLGRRSDGPSMHLAGLLAVIRQVNSNPPLLDRACCVAQPDGERLVSVGGLSQKLDAFRREYGTGTLLVRCRDAKAAEFDAYFDTVWEVDSLAELARQLEQAELLQVFLDGQPLSAVDAKTILNRVRQLEEIEHRYAEALDLCQRVERAGFSPAVPSRLQRKFRQRVIDFYRHLGAYRKAAELAQAEHQRSRSSRDSVLRGAGPSRPNLCGSAVRLSSVRGHPPAIEPLARALDRRPAAADAANASEGVQHPGPGVGRLGAGRLGGPVPALGGDPARAGADRPAADVVLPDPGIPARGPATRGRGSHRPNRSSPRPRRDVALVPAHPPSRLGPPARPNLVGPRDGSGHGFDSGGASVRLLLPSDRPPTRSVTGGCPGAVPAGPPVPDPGFARRRPAQHPAVPG
jgi:hypothetical protein